MKTAIFTVACLVLATTALAGRELTTASTIFGGSPPVPPVASPISQTSCSAFSNLQIVVKHGTCSGWARAGCTAEAEAAEEVKTIVATNATHICQPANVNVVAKQVATAIARVYVRAFTKISCDGKGFGCGFSAATGDSYSSAYAEAVAIGVAAAFDSDASAVCVADIKALAQTISHAQASAVAESCVTGVGKAKTFVDQFVEGVSTAIAEAIVRATAKACKKGEDATSSCAIDVLGSSKSNDRVTKRGRNKSQRKGNANTTGITSGTVTVGKPKICEAVNQRQCCFNEPLCQTFGWKRSFVNSFGSMVIEPIFGGPAVCACW